MFGLMEITAQLDETTKLAIIPTVVLPFTIVGMILTSIATWIAAIFGVELKAEGPKRLFEVLMKPKIIILSLVGNAVIYGGIKGGQYIQNGPYPLWWVRYQNSTPQPSLDFAGGAPKNAGNQNLAKNTFAQNAMNSNISNKAEEFSGSHSEAKPNHSGSKKMSSIFDPRLTEIQVLWENKLEGATFGSPLIDGHSLYTGDYAGHLLELDLNTGKTTRRFHIGKPVMATPLIWQQKIFVGEGEHLTHDARLYAFDLKTGTFTKAFATRGHIERAAIISEPSTEEKVQLKQQKLAPLPLQKQTGDNPQDSNQIKVPSHNRALLIFPAGKDGLYAIDARTMEKVWQAPLGHVDASAVADSDRVFVGTGLEMGFNATPTKIFALDIHTGKILWEKTLATSVWGVPVIWNDVVCFSVGDVYNNTHYGQLACYDKATGKEYFAFNTTGALISQGILRGDQLIIADFHGTIYQFDLKNKTLDWTLLVPVKDFNYASAVIDSKERLILPGSEGLYVYSLSSQKLLKIWKPQDGWQGSYSNVALHKDLWILSDATGKVRALKPLE